MFNSENGMDAIGAKRIRWLPGVRLAYERENVYGYTIHFEYHLTYWRFPNAWHFPEYVVISPAIIRNGDTVFILAVNNLDLDIHYCISNHVSFDFGPTLSLVSRSLDVQDYDFTDRLIAIQETR
jgi:hypothetical protein